MTLIKIDLRGADYTTGVTGSVLLSPTRRVHVERDAEDFIVLPAPFVVELVDGLALVELEPTSTDWVWSIIERTKGGIRRYVAVPDSPFTVDYGDLEDVDPSTLVPLDPLPPTAQEVLEEAQLAIGSAALAEAAAEAAEASADSVSPGQANGTATLDGSAKLPESQVPLRLSEAALSATIATQVGAAIDAADIDVDGAAARSALARGKRLMSSVIGTRAETMPDVTIGALGEYRTAGGLSIGGSISFTAATDTVTTSVPHGLSVGDRVEFGTLSASNNLVAGNSSYWVVEVPTATTFKVSTSRGGAVRDITADSTSVGLWRREWAYNRADAVVNPGLRGIEAPIVQGVNSSPTNDYVRADPAATTYAPGVQVGPHPAVMTLYRGARIDLLLRHDAGARFVVFVDGQEILRITSADFTAAGIAAGSVGRLPLSFTAARDRVIKIVGDRSWSYIAGFNIEAGQSLFFPAALPKGARTIFAGDSFIEGEGAVAEPTIVNWVSWALGWEDSWNSGSGSTGYINDGTRQSLLDRYVNDIVNRAPDRVVIAMGFNDTAQTLSAVIAAAETIWDAVLAANPYVDLVIVGPWPNSGGTTTITAPLLAIDAGLAAAAAARLLPYISPIQDGITFTRADATHPDPAGHKKLGMYLAGRIAQLSVAAQ